MILKEKNLLFILLISIFSSCAPSRFVAPLEKDENALTMSLGGPMSKIPGVGTLPIPHTNLTYGRGLTDDITVFGGWYPTAALFGVFQFEAGGVFNLVSKETWGISTTPMLNYNIDKWERKSKLWPNVDLNFYYKKPLKKNDNKSWLFYAGANNWLELSKYKSLQVLQSNHYIFSPQIGARLVGVKWDYNLEYKLIAPGKNNENFTVSYSSILPNNGANGLYFSVYRRF